MSPACRPLGRPANLGAALTCVDEVAWLCSISRAHTPFISRTSSPGNLLPTFSVAAALPHHDTLFAFFFGGFLFLGRVEPHSDGWRLLEVCITHITGTIGTNGPLAGRLSREAEQTLENEFLSCREGQRGNSSLMPLPSAWLPLKTAGAAWCQREGPELGGLDGNPEISSLASRAKESVHCMLLQCFGLVF